MKKRHLMWVLGLAVLGFGVMDLAKTSEACSCGVEKSSNTTQAVPEVVAPVNQIASVT
jgi:hypothetical protein